MTKEQTLSYAIDYLYDEGFLCNYSCLGIPSNPLTSTMKDELSLRYDRMLDRDGYITAKSLAQATIESAKRIDARKAKKIVRRITKAGNIK